MHSPSSNSHRLLPRKTGSPINKRRYVRSFYLASLLGVFCAHNIAQANPAIEAVDVNPNPLIRGQAFTITARASTDVTQATTTVDFFRLKDPPLRFSLSQQGANWVGSGIVPNLDLSTNKDEARVRVIVFDALGHRDETLLRVNVVVPPVTAAFSGGILTVTGDDTDNSIIVSRDVAGS